MSDASTHPYVQAPPGSGEPAGTWHLRPADHVVDVFFAGGYPTVCGLTVQGYTVWPKSMTPDADGYHGPLCEACFR